MEKERDGGVVYLSQRIVVSGELLQILQHILEKKKKGTSFYTLVSAGKAYIRKTASRKNSGSTQTMDNKA